MLNLLPHKSRMMKRIESIRDKQRRILCLLLFFGSMILQAQNPLIIRGIIKDQSTQIPIEGVNIRIQNTYSGTTTNAQGIFELRVRNLPAILLITHIAYFGKQIIVTQSQADSLVVFLSHKPIDLEEAEIIAETYKVFKGKHQEVIDYDFLDTNLLILAYNFNKNRHELIVTNEQFDTLGIKDISYLKKPAQIFKDCLGNCHLITKDTAYQVYFDEESIYLIYPNQLMNFYNLLGNCLFETNTHLAFEGDADKTQNLDYSARLHSDIPGVNSKNDAWKHLFYFVNKQSHEKTILIATNEWEKKQDAYEQAMFIYQSGTTFRSFGDILRGEEMFFYKPAFQTLKILNDTIYYFNHLKSRIDVFSDELTLTDSIHIDYQNRKNWKPVIITDRIKNKAYTIFTIGAKLSLAEIDLQNGSVKEVHKIEKLFPAKIRINNGYLYFLYHNVNNVWGTKRLFQGELPNTNN